MKKSTTLFTLMSLTILSGCMTMNTLKESKNLYKEGRYVSGTFTGLIGLTFVPLADIFTLGGLLSAEEASQTWTGAANTYGDVERRNQAIKQQEALRARQQAALRAQQQNYSYSNSQNYSTGSSNNTISSSSKVYDRRTAAPLNQCITVDSKSNSLATFLINKCSQKVWVSWLDEGNCRKGCADDVYPNNKRSINKQKGKMTIAVCPDPFRAYAPNAPRPTGYSWSSVGGGRFECVQW